MLVDLNGIKKTFGGPNVLDDVSFGIEVEQIVGLIGPNGAGKTTLVNLLAGTLSPSAGEILYEGRNLIGLGPNQICHLGIARTFQLVQTFPSVSVIDYVRNSAVQCDRHQSNHAIESHTLECIELLGLMAIKDHRMTQLTHAIRRLVEIARVLAEKPVLALLDEPLAGLNSAESQKIKAVMSNIRDQQGVSVLWVEHGIDAVSNVCDSVIVLNYGLKLADGTPAEIAENQKVAEAYLKEPII
jgi:branched-chain amino acid transport system ATP-binding protein